MKTLIYRICMSSHTHCHVYASLASFTSKTISCSHLPSIKRVRIPCFHKIAYTGSNQASICRQHGFASHRRFETSKTSHQITGYSKGRGYASFLECDIHPSLKPWCFNPVDWLREGHSLALEPRSIGVCLSSSQQIQHQEVTRRISEVKVKIAS